MHPHEIHHIKAYIVFSVISVACIGLLVYLYFPKGSTNNIQSSVLEDSLPATTVASVTEEDIIVDEVKSEKNFGNDVSGRRMRLTKILIRSQKELQTLEAQRKSSPQGLDPVSEQKIVKLREKIVNMEKMITELK